MVDPLLARAPSICNRKLQNLKIENTIARVAKLADAPDLGFTVIPSVGKAYRDNMLIANDQLIEGGEIELQLAALAQRLQCLDEHQISRSGTEARVGRGWNNEEFARFEMRD